MSYLAKTTEGSPAYPQLRPPHQTLGRQVTDSRSKRGNLVAMLQVWRGYANEAWPLNA